MPDSVFSMNMMVGLSIQMYIKTFKVPNVIDNIQKKVKIQNNLK